MGLFKHIKRSIKYRIMRKIFGKHYGGHGHYGHHGYPPPPPHYGHGPGYGHGYRHGGHGYRHGGRYGYRH
ncbi:hypothetical protein [Longispora sp. NPDC051575]|uniref:hypothetical protein n=1 Tax=Longispora sp. NPDC051575 TaxID=3154943 RepID=UPI00342E461E